MKTIFVYLNVTQFGVIKSLHWQHSKLVRQTAAALSRRRCRCRGSHTFLMLTSDTFLPICLIAAHCPFRGLIMVLQSSPVSWDIRGGGGCRGCGGWGLGLASTFSRPLVVLPNKKQTAIVVQLGGYPQSHTLSLFMEPPVNCGLSQLCPFSAL